MEVNQGESIQAAINAAVAGDQIDVYGTHHEVIKNRRGVSVYGHDAVIDGEYRLPTGGASVHDPRSDKYHLYGGLVDFTEEDSVFEGFGIIRSLGRAVRFYNGATNNRLADCILAHHREMGILVNHDGVTDTSIVNVDIYDTNNFAPYSRSAGELDWAAGIGILGKNTTVLGGSIFENWGEGLIAAKGSENTRIEKVDVYNNYSAQIYVNHAWNVDLIENKAWFDDPRFHRGGAPSGGIILSNEGNYQGHYNRDINVLRNEVAGCLHNFAIWHSAHPSNNVLVQENILREAYQWAVRIGGPQHENVQLLNNTIFQEDESKIWSVSVDIVREGNLINPTEPEPEPEPPPPEHDHQEILDRLDQLESKQSDIFQVQNAQAQNIGDLANIQAAQGKKLLELEQAQTEDENAFADLRKLLVDILGVLDSYLGG